MGTTGTVEAMSSRYGIEGVHDIDVYEQHGGYEGLRIALTRTPDEMVQLMKDAGVRGRGGAGFPTGLKWSFIAKGTGKPTYLVCNADESEPGTFKDRPLMERDPHQLIEGMVCSGLAINSEYGYIYLRGEFGWLSRRLSKAIAQAYEKGYLGEDVMGSGKRFHLYLHRGAAAYICGEETALLESLEGRRGQPRLRPPFPAAHGLYGCPTTVNNVESISTLPWLLRHGAEWYQQWGTEKSPGPKLMCVSGDVTNPGNHEFALGTPISEIIEACGGMKDGKALQFFNPGGSSTPYLTPDHVDLPYSFEDIQGAGSLLGTGALMIYNEDRCIVDVTLRYTEFYEHESCGKCTPCREGGYWLSQVLRRIETGNGRMEDLDVLQDVCDNIFGRSFCALGDALTSPISSGLKHFRGEFEAHVRDGRCPRGITEPVRRDGSSLIEPEFARRVAQDPLAAAGLV
jgi:NADH-quinone oxidoreductase subunit F